MGPRGQRQRGRGPVAKQSEKEGRRACGASAAAGPVAFRAEGGGFPFFFSFLFISKPFQK